MRAKNLDAGKHADGQGLWLIKRSKGAGKWIVRLVIRGDSQAPSSQASFLASSTTLKRATGMRSRARAEHSCDCRARPIVEVAGHEERIWLAFSHTCKRRLHLQHSRLGCVGAVRGEVYIADGH